MKFGKATYKIDGEVVSEQEYVRRTARRRRKGRRISRQRLAKWPLTPDAIAINPVHVPATMEVDKKNGVPTEYTRSGEPIITGPAHYRKYLALHGFHHRNAGYGDRPPP